MKTRELRITYETNSSLPRWDGRRQFNGPLLTAEFFRPIMETEHVEVFGLACLNNKNRLIGYHELSRGTLSETLVHPREVFKVAFLANAASVIVGHNHPSGDPEPSKEDVALTERLKHSGALLGVHLLDHVIIGEGGAFVSFKVRGEL